MVVMTKIRSIVFNSSWMIIVGYSVFLVLCNLSIFGELFLSNSNLNLLISDVVLGLMLAIGLPLLFWGILLTFIALLQIMMGKDNSIENLKVIILCSGLTVVIILFNIVLIVRADHSKFDGFASGLSIPVDTILSETNKEYVSEQPEEITALLEGAFRIALSKAGNNNSTVQADVSNLAYLCTNEPLALFRYLVSTPCWHVTKDQERVLATRRIWGDSSWYNDDLYYFAHQIQFSIDGRSPKKVVSSFSLDYFLKSLDRLWKPYLVPVRKRLSFENSSSNK